MRYPSAIGLTKQNGKKDAQSEGEEPQGWGRGAYLTDGAGDASGDAWIEHEPAGVAKFESHEDETGDGAIYEVAHQRREKIRDGIGAPIALAGKNEGFKRYRTGVPPDQAEQPTPGDTHADVRGFVAEQEAVQHAEDDADEEVDEQNLQSGGVVGGVHEPRQNTRNQKDRRGDDSANQSSERSPRERAQRLNAGSFELAIERVGFDEEAEPEFVERGVGEADDQAVENVADQRAKDRCGAVSGPIEAAMRDPGKDRQVAKEPPKDSVAEAPTHARTWALDVSLEEKTEADSNCHGNGEMQKH